MRSLISKGRNINLPGKRSFSIRAINFYPKYKNPILNYDKIPEFTVLQDNPPSEKLKALDEKQPRILNLIKEKYPHLSEIWPFYNAIAYRYDSMSPQELIERGGFVRDAEVSFSKNSINGDSTNTGVVNFSLIVGITGIFIPEDKELGYLYAVPLKEAHIAPGQWRQPFLGVVPFIDQWCIARKIEEVTPRQVILGNEITAYGIDRKTFIEGHSRNEFLTDKSIEEFLQGSVTIPRQIKKSTPTNAAMYDIQDTHLSKILIQDRKIHSIGRS